ncbi:MAG: hypothetical protein KatS3mg127_2010 [Silanimonas sp.]|nr:MAG: hypothetical protein KatS3mg127_2010 [Silanimonas sp.]
MIPTRYADWRRCIEQDCGIELTPDFIAARIADLRDPRSYHTQQFLKTYGPAHHARVLSWFVQAASESASA